MTADGRLLGLAGIADNMKPHAADAIQRFKDLGRILLILTGAKFLPEESGVHELQADGSRMVVVWDGINDAPTLIQADVGIAISAGTELAIGFSDV